MTWRCEAHGAVAADDCPRCDDELITLTEAEECEVHCRLCERVIPVGESAWAEDWKVIGLKGVTVQIRYTCDDCGVDA